MGWTDWIISTDVVTDAVIGTFRTVDTCGVMADSVLSAAIVVGIAGTFAIPADVNARCLSFAFIVIGSYIAPAD